MESVPNFTGEPIGIVEEGIPREKSGGIRKSRHEIVSRVRVYERFAEGLLGLDGYSHIVVVWWMKEETNVKLRVTPWARTDMPEVGIFATHFPARPNHIGVSVVELLGVSKNVLNVKGFDAWTGSRILDIKPYDFYDIVNSPRVPDWFRIYWDERSHIRNAKSTP